MARSRRSTFGPQRAAWPRSPSHPPRAGSPPRPSRQHPTSSAMALTPHTGVYGLLSLSEILKFVWPRGYLCVCTTSTAPVDHTYKYPHLRSIPMNNQGPRTFGISGAAFPTRVFRWHCVAQRRLRVSDHTYHHIDCLMV